jgi:hypothetical protein
MSRAGPACYEKLLSIRKRLAALDSGNAEWQTDLAIGYDRLATPMQHAASSTVPRRRSRQAWRSASSCQASGCELQDPLSAEARKCVLQPLAAGPLLRRGAASGQALEILERLDADGRLAPARFEWIERTKKLLHETKGIQA